MELADLIAQVESSMNQHAMRFEREAFQRQWNATKPTSYESCVQRIQTIHSCSRATADMICFSSWGMYQEMGFNLWDSNGFNYQHDCIDFCSTFLHQRGAFNSFLKKANLQDFIVDDIMKDEAKRLEFITKYNGPGNPDAYWQLIQKAYTTLQYRGL